MPLIVLSHKDHGRHIVYSESEIPALEKSGWKRDEEWTQKMRGTPKPAEPAPVEKPNPAAIEQPRQTLGLRK